MKNISLIDSNFKVETKLDQPDIRFYDVRQSPFKIYGVFYESGKFRRLPEKVAKTVNEGVYNLHANTAGGRVRFKTDSEYIAINTKMPNIGKMPHFALTGSAGFDLYVFEESERYIASFIPPFEMRDGYESIIHFGSSEMREIVINFPLYSEVSEFYVGLCDKATVCEPNPYRIEKPIVYYGSSITQGGCASRPGNSYQSAVSRRFSANYLNLGFSGNARAEDEIAEYIKNLDMSVFVYDYDHNAPTVEHLEKTHERMFRIIREANPDLPVIFMSRPKYYLTKDEQKRLEIIRTTYNKAIESNDRNVYLIDGRMLTELCGNEGTVDSCHPNDLGFASMAKAVCDVLESIIGE
ncbi:MAG: SGNH/GDSL hydrolase family protein [Clostridia bacterium]|nr:SGNH/GDSL hydrolase family protein [Clostridia bacterium]